MMICGEVANRVLATVSCVSLPDDGRRSHGAPEFKERHRSWLHPGYIVRILGTRRNYTAVAVQLRAGLVVKFLSLREEQGSR